MCVNNVEVTVNTCTCTDLFTVNTCTCTDVDVLKILTTNQSGGMYSTGGQKIMAVTKQTPWAMASDAVLLIAINPWHCAITVTSAFE